MGAWSSFFQAELGAAAALAGLLFVSVSVNQAKILELDRMADRGLETLLMLFLVIVITSLSLVPGQPLRLLGAEITVLAIATLCWLVPLQRAYRGQRNPVHRVRSVRMAKLVRLAMSVIVCAGLVLVWRGDATGFYVLAPGILLTFFAAGASAWVLLIEINR